MGLTHYNAQPATTDAALYTSSGTTTLTHIVAINATGGASTITLSVHRAISGAVEVIAAAVPVPATSALELVYDVDEALEEIVLDNGDSLHGLAGNATTVTVLAFE
jgi:hypothetical protein